MFFKFVEVHAIRVLAESHPRQPDKDKGLRSKQARPHTPFRRGSGLAASRNVGGSTRRPSQRRAIVQGRTPRGLGAALPTENKEGDAPHRGRQLWENVCQHRGKTDELSRKTHSADALDVGGASPTLPELRHWVWRCCCTAFIPSIAMALQAQIVTRVRARAIATISLLSGKKGL